jgi:hypothetical protein
MTEEVLAEVPAPEQVETASPEPEVSTPEVTETVSKTFTQEELDAAIGKRLAREQRFWYIWQLYAYTKCRFAYTTTSGRAYSGYNC